MDSVLTKGDARPLLDYDEMWRPRAWLRPPANPDRRGYGWELTIVLLAAAANVLDNRLLADAFHVPFNLAMAAVFVAMARRAGVTWTDLGMRSDRLRRGLLVGGITFAIITVGVVIAATIPVTRELFEDERVIGLSSAAAVYEVLIRIPFGTALYEEILFRGVLFGMFVRRTTPLNAALISAAFFGLWHILPTIETLDTNPAGESFTGAIGVTIALVGAVVGTGLAGLAFTWIRLRANSILAPILTHIATNASAFAAAFVVVNGLG